MSSVLLVFLGLCFSLATGDYTATYMDPTCQSEPNTIRAYNFRTNSLPCYATPGKSYVSAAVLPGSAPLLRNAWVIKYFDKPDCTGPWREMQQYNLQCYPDLFGGGILLSVNRTCDNGEMRANYFPTADCTGPPSRTDFEGNAGRCQFTGDGQSMFYDCNKCPDLVDYQASNIKGIVIHREFVETLDAVNEVARQYDVMVKPFHSIRKDPAPGGAKNSSHKLAAAIDFWVDKCTTKIEPPACMKNCYENQGACPYPKVANFLNALKANTDWTYAPDWQGEPDYNHVEKSGDVSSSRAAIQKQRRALCNRQCPELKFFRRTNWSC